MSAESPCRISRPPSFLQLRASDAPLLGEKRLDPAHWMPVGMLWRPNRRAQIPFSSSVRKTHLPANTLKPGDFCPADDRCRIVPCCRSFDPRGRKQRNMIDHGDLAMRKRSLLLLSLLVPAFLGLGGYAVLQAQQKTSTASGKRWSDAATWPDNKVPGKDAVVTI